MIASMNDQDVPNRRIPDGCVDAYEGALLCFKADGEIAGRTITRYIIANKPLCRLGDLPPYSYVCGSPGASS